MMIRVEERCFSKKSGASFMHPRMRGGVRRRFGEHWGSVDGIRLFSIVYLYKIR
jgi:hypothetical protein